jgi:hypothetical protein
MSLHEEFQKPGKKFAVLIDPDKPTDKQVHNIVENANKANVDFFSLEAVF